MHPASTAHTTRCGAWRTSLRTCAVPRMNAGTLHRAKNTPHTMISEMVIGEISGLTTLIGASAPPSHAPAANPQKMPSACRLRRRVVVALGTAAGLASAIMGFISAKLIEQHESAYQDGERNPEMDVGSDGSKKRA